MLDTGLPPAYPCQAPSFLWSPPALKQATRAFRLAGDRIAIGARGSSRKQDPRQCLEVLSCLPLTKVQQPTSRLAKYRKIGGSELQKCTVNRKGISFTRRQQPMNRITLPPRRREA